MTDIIKKKCFTQTHVNFMLTVLVLILATGVMGADKKPLILIIYHLANSSRLFGMGLQWLPMQN